jgi:hypothetical protein
VSPATAPSAASSATTQATSAPSTRTSAASKDEAPAAPPKDFASLYHVIDPSFPSTQPLSYGLPLTDAARVKLDRPVYLCLRGDLWAQHADAPPIEKHLPDAANQQTHVTRDDVVFMAWGLEGAGRAPTAIVRERDGSFALVTPEKRLPLKLAGEPDWSRASVYRKWVVIPTTRGIELVRDDKGTVESLAVKLSDPLPGTTCHALVDLKGLLAWSSSTDDRTPSQVARFDGSAWKLLTPDDRWPKSIVQLTPMSDGTVLTLHRKDDRLRLIYVLLDAGAASVDEKKIEEAIAKLYSTSPKDRREAMRELSNFGASAWPTIEKLAEAQRSDVRARLRQILGNQTEPSLDGLRPLPGTGRLLARYPGEGVLVRFSAGVQTFDDSGASRDIVPALVLLRPGFGALLLPDDVSTALTDEPGARLRIGGGDEFVVERPKGEGPGRWMGNHLAPMLRESERDRFPRFTGIDSMGRWVFASSDGKDSLVIDVTILDPAPRMPVWVLENANGSMGWDDEGWPCRKLGATWALRETAWQALTPERSKEVFRVKREDSPEAQNAPTTAPTAPLLTDAQGNAYSNGLDALVVRTRDGITINWPLPSEARGPGVFDSSPVLLEANGHLFLFNAPGKCVRLKPTPTDAEPFKVEAIFTRGLPQHDIRRIWKDPAGRLIVASGGTRLAICFPTGTIPLAIQNVMSDKSLREALGRE